MDAAPEHVGLADGDLPRELAHELNDQLFDVLALVSAMGSMAMHELREGDATRDRIHRLSQLTAEAIGQVVASMAPYV
ncbi:MAG: hypothetical protein ACTHL8_23260 [Burkholderiaceae bacterium]